MKTFFFSVMFLLLGSCLGIYHEHRFQENCAAGLVEPRFSRPCIGHHEAVEATPDVGFNAEQVAADLKELDRRDFVIADHIKKLEAQVQQLHQDDISTISFIEELFKQFFGVEIQAEPAVQPQASPAPQSL